MNSKTWIVSGLLVSCSAAGWAAGGHHAVDDAGILDEGKCEVESWLEQAPASARLLHAGANCRVGPIQLGFAGEYERQSANPSATGWQLGVKWARELAGGWSVGASVGPGWQAHVRPRYQGTTVALLASWAATETVGLHANLGRDVLNQADDQTRAGVAVDWSFREGWQVIGERFRQEGGHFVRAGLRWEPAADWTLDLSRAHHLSGNGTSSWTLAFKREFGR